VFEKGCGGEHDVGVVGGVGEKLLVDHGEKVGPPESADDFIVVGADRCRIRTVYEQRLDRRRGQSVECAAQLHHVDDAGGTSQGFLHQLGHLERFGVQAESTAGRELEATAKVLPRSDETGQHGDGAHRHTASVGALNAVVDADYGRPHGGILAGELADVAAEMPVQWATFSAILLGATFRSSKPTV